MNRCYDHAQTVMAVVIQRYAVPQATEVRDRVLAFAKCTHVHVSVPAHRAWIDACL